MHFWKIIAAWALMFTLSACALVEPQTDLPPLVGDFDEVHVIARVECAQPRLGSGSLCHTISEPEQIASIVRFMDARLDKWRTPIAGAPIHPVRIELYRGGKLIAGIGLSAYSIEGEMFLSRPMTAAEVDELLSLVRLDRSHLRFRPQDPVPE